VSKRSQILVLFLFVLPIPGVLAQDGGELRVRAWENKVEGSILSDPWLLNHADEALAHLYNMRYQSADSLFDIIAEAYPKHPIGPFLKSLTIWWQILPTLTVGDTSMDKAFLNQMSQVFALSRAAEDDQRYAFDAKFFSTAAHGFRGRLLSDREQWLAAAQDGKQALDHIFEIAQADTTNADLLFGVGAYDYFAEAVPEQYPLVRPLMFFFPDGDKERGLARLQRAAREAAYFLTMIYTVYEPNFRKALDNVTMLHTRYPGNALFHVMLGRIQFRWGQRRAAGISFSSVVSRYEQGSAGYVKPLVSQAHYYLARNALRVDSVDVALEHFQMALDLESGYSHDSFVRVMTTLYRGIALQANGRNDEAAHAFARVLEMHEYSSSHERARSQLDLLDGGGE